MVPGGMLCSSDVEVTLVRGWLRGGMRGIYLRRQTFRRSYEVEERPLSFEAVELVT